MAQTIKLKRSATQGASPTTSQLELGEVAINTYDGKMYIKKDDGTESIVEIGAGGSGGGLTSSFTLYEYTATASQTTFSGSDSNSNTLAYDTGTPPKILVYLNGVLLDHTTDYTATNGTSVVLTTGAAAGDLVQIGAYNSEATSDVDIALDDDVKLKLGDDDDLEIYHDGSDSVINQTGTGDLLIQKDETTVAEFDVDGLTVTGDIEADEFIGDLRGAVLFKAQAGEALAKGDVVYISGISGNTTIVSKADADDASKMPAFGLAAAAASANSSVEVYTSGTISGIDTSSFTVGDEVFTSTTAGELTATPPTGESAALQKIGKVTRSHASSGSIFIIGAGRSNAVPNLNEGKLFVGNSSNQAVADDTVHVDIANSRVGIGTTSPNYKLDVASTGGGINISGTGAYLRWNSGDMQIKNEGSYKMGFYTYNSSDAALNRHMVIDTNGYVGIGTASPGVELDIKRHTNAYPLRIGSETGQGRTIVFADVAGTPTKYNWIAGTQYTVDNAFEITPSTAVGGYTFSSPALLIKQDGKVGIGTTSPQRPLHIHNSGTSQDVRIQLSDGTTTDAIDKGFNIIKNTAQNAYLWNYQDASMFFGTNNVERLKITNTGNFEFNNGNFTEVGTISSGNITMTGNQLKIISSTDSNLGWMVRDNTYVTDEMDITATRLGSGNQPTLGVAGQNGINFYVGGSNVGSFNSSGNLTGLGTISSGNITTTGYLRGPSTFTIDPATHGDDTGTVVIAGNLQVDGTTTTINSTTLTVDDKNITLASGSTNAAAANGAGLTVDCGSGTDATLNYNGTLDTWEFNKELRLTTGSFASYVNGNRYIKYRSAYDSAAVADFELKSDNNSAAVARITGTGTADLLQVFDNTSQVFTIEDGGNVGIGTSSPNSTVGKVDIAGAATNYNTSPMITFRDTAGATDSRNWSIGNIAINYGDFHIGCGDSNSDYFDATSHSKFMINKDGNVGIGTTSPDSKLHINTGSGTGDANTVIIDRAGSTDYSGVSFATAGTVDWSIGQNSAGNFEVFEDGLDSKTRLTIKTGGRVGIGTGSPSEMLQIDSADSAIRVNTTNAANNSELQLVYNNGTNGMFFRYHPNSALAYIDNTYPRTQGQSYGDILFRQNYAGTMTEHMRLTAYDGFLGIGTNTPKAKLQVEVAGIDTTTTSTSATTQVAIDTFAAATFRSARYTIQVTNSTDSTYHITEILLIHDGTTPQITEYGTIFTGSAEATFDADISSGNVRLLATPATTDSMTFKVVRHCITV